MYAFSWPARRSRLATKPGQQILPPSPERLVGSGEIVVHGVMLEWSLVANHPRPATWPRLLTVTTRLSFPPKHILESHFWRHCLKRALAFTLFASAAVGF